MLLELLRDLRDPPQIHRELRTSSHGLVEYSAEALSWDLDASAGACAGAGAGADVGAGAGAGAGAGVQLSSTSSACHLPSSA